MATQRAEIAIIMGSQSDWSTMRHAAETLDALGVAYESRIVSAHRTPDRLYAFAKGAREAGFKVIIAGAGGAAHLPGMTAALRAQMGEAAVKAATAVGYVGAGTIEFIADDELVEVTPKSIRIRKRWLKEHERKRAARELAPAAAV